MNKQNFWTIMAFVVLLCITTSAYSVDYFDGLVCKQDISTVKNLIPVSTEHPHSMLYEKKDDHITIGNVESTLVNDVFWDNKFYGKIVAICGVENFNDVLRFFEKTYGYPIIIEQQRVTMWLTPELVFRVRRFSYHQGQVDILCRDMLREIEMGEEQTDPQMENSSSR